MKTYPEIVTEYMKDTLKGMLDEFSEYTDVDFLCEKIYSLFREDEFLSGIRNADEAKERVLANIEYVMDSVNENADSWEYKGKWFAEKDWNELDCSAMLTALDDVCYDVAEWLVNEMKFEEKEKNMKTYIEMATEYMKAKLLDMMDEIPKDLEKEFEGRKWYELDEDDLSYWIRALFIDRDPFVIDGEDEEEMREMVLANMEYVMYALDMHRGWIDDEEIVDYICSKNWHQLDFEARFEGVDDSLADVTKWLKGELEKKVNSTPAKAKEPEYTYEYIFLNIGDVVEVRFSNLTTFQLHQIMKNNPEFILSGIIKKEVK